jgi:hypothetical protein
MQTDGQTGKQEMTKRVIAFRNFVNAPQKIRCASIMIHVTIFCTTFSKIILFPKYILYENRHGSLLLRTEYVLARVGVATNRQVAGSIPDGVTEIFSVT